GAGAALDTGAIAEGMIEGAAIRLGRLRFIGAGGRSSRLRLGEEDGQLLDAIGFGRLVREDVRGKGGHVGATNPVGGCTRNTLAKVQRIWNQHRLAALLVILMSTYVDFPLFPHAKLMVSGVISTSFGGGGRDAAAIL
ncbi:hypothetical protein PFISCL1PPCAC_928, partial [Pristionchus fissidentatus]